MDDKQWKQINYPYDFILNRYKDVIQNLHHVMKKELVYLDDKLTDKELDIFSELLGTETIEGLFILNALRKIINIEGDICEYGVAQGATSTLIANTISNTNKKLYLFDSFIGLPRPTKEDELKDDIFNLGSMNAYEGTMACHPNECIYRLQKRSLANEKIQIVCGFIDKTINNTPENVSFAFVDFDFYLPIKIALEHLHDRLSHGGVIIVDDYDFFSTGVKKAVAEFLSDKNDYHFFVPNKEYGNFCIIEKK